MALSVLVVELLEVLSLVLIESGAGSTMRRVAR